MKMKQFGETLKANLKDKDVQRSLKQAGAMAVGGVAVKKPAKIGEAVAKAMKKRSVVGKLAKQGASYGAGQEIKKMLEKRRKK